MSDVLKIAIGATVYVILIIIFILWWASLFRWKGKEGDTCAYCGDVCDGQFCSESHSLLFYDEEDLARNEEIIEAEEEEALREIEGLEREEKRSKAY